MKIKWVALVLAMFLMMYFVNVLIAEQKSANDILKEGLIGAGAGAIGGAASGAKGRDVWKGALAGAGVNIVGGALLDSISGEKVSSVERVQGMGGQDAYSVGYQNGFSNGYKTGYTEGYKDGIKENLRK